MKLILLFLAVILLSSIFNISDSTATDNSSATSNESAATLAYSCQCVAFRLDDIQDFFLAQTQMEIIRTFEKHNASLTIGIIGNLTGNDRVLVAFLKEKISAGSNENNSNGFALEVANHGWAHEDFTLLDKEEQSILVEKTNDKILNILNIKPKTFIPPFNRLNNDTLDALRENHMNYISGNAMAYPASTLTNDLQNRSTNDNNTVTGPTPNNDAIFHFPSLATTGDINADYLEWFGNSHDDVFTDVNASMHRLGYAVVTMHPQEHSIRNGFEYEGSFDSEQIHELELLIDDIRAAGFRIVTISQISEDNSTSIPEFSSYSLHTILIISIVLVTWFSIRGHGTISRRFL